MSYGYNGYIYIEKQVYIDSFTTMCTQEVQGILKCVPCGDDYTIKTINVI